MDDTSGAAQLDRDGKPRFDNARVLMYSHDTFGLGHLRRCRAIAHSLVEDFRGVTVLIISGASIAGNFDYRARVDFVKIPSVIKLRNGDYTSLSAHIDVRDTLAMRQSSILHTAKAFKPDIMIVDKEPLGLRGEVEETLIHLRSQGTKLVLGLREVMDAPHLLAAEWAPHDVMRKIGEYYDAVWVYGPPDFHDPFEGMEVPKSVREKMRFVGFLKRSAEHANLMTNRPKGDYILVTTGGGGDGADLVSDVLGAYAADPDLPRALIVLGPYMPNEQRQGFMSEAAAFPQVEVIGFDARLEELMAGAQAVVAMGGYNTFCEIMSFDKPSLLVPRILPREEQLIRARRAAELGLVDLLLPDASGDPQRLAAALRALPGRTPPSLSGRMLGMEGLDQISSDTRELARGSCPPRGRGVSDVPLRHLVVVLKGYPRLSETFIAQELRGLEQAGFRLSIFSMRHPTDTKHHPVHDEMQASVTYLPEYLHDEPLRVLRALLTGLRRPGFGTTLRQFLGDLRTDCTRNRVRRFGQALVLAAEWPEGGQWIYAHFLHTPASVAGYASLLTGVPFSVSAHAKDIWTQGKDEIAAKLRAAAWTVTCTQSGAAYLAFLAPDPTRVHLSYHGLDLDRFPPMEGSRPPRDGSGDAVTVLSVGRAVPKKGTDTLLRALAELPRTLNWRFLHIGAGEEVRQLKVLAESLKITGRCHWQGARTQTEVLAAYRAADLFALASRITGDGDRDGLPNVLVEAASQRMALVATRISAIPELVTDGESGLLVPPEDVRALGEALSRAIREPALRDRLGRAAEAKVRAQFDCRRSIRQLQGLFTAGWDAHE